MPVDHDEYLIHLFENQIAGVEGKLTARIDALEKAMSLTEENAARVPTLLMQSEARLAETIRNLKDDRREATSLGLQSTETLFRVQTDAHSTAVDKMEKALSAQIKNVDDKTVDNTTRIAALEVKLGSGEGARQGSSNTLSLIFSAASFLYAVAATIGIVIALLHESK